MNKYKVNVGEVFTFEADDPSGVVDFLKSVSPVVAAENDEKKVLRFFANSMANYDHKSYRFTNKKHFAEDMMKYGHLTREED